MSVSKKNTLPLPPNGINSFIIYLSMSFIYHFLFPLQGVSIAAFCLTFGHSSWVIQGHAVSELELLVVEAFNTNAQSLQRGHLMPLCSRRSEVFDSRPRSICDESTALYVAGASIPFCKASFPSLNIVFRNIHVAANVENTIDLKLFGSQIWKDKVSLQTQLS